MFYIIRMRYRYMIIYMEYNEKRRLHYMYRHAC